MVYLNLCKSFEQVHQRFHYVAEFEILTGLSCKCYVCPLLSTKTHYVFSGASVIGFFSFKLVWSVAFGWSVWSIWLVSMEIKKDDFNEPPSTICRSYGAGEGAKAEGIYIFPDRNGRSGRCYSPTGELFFQTVKHTFDSVFHQIQHSNSKEIRV